MFLLFQQCRLFASIVESHWLPVLPSDNTRVVTQDMENIAVRHVPLCSSASQIMRNTEVPIPVIKAMYVPHVDRVLPQSEACKDTVTGKRGKEESSLVNFVTKDLRIRTS